MPFIIFGVATNTSISSLFVAGIVPALLRARGLVVVWWMLARGMVQPRRTWRERGRALGKFYSAWRSTRCRRGARPQTPRLLLC